MDRVRILISYDDIWEQCGGVQQYVGGYNKGLFVPKNLTFVGLVELCLKS